MITLNINDKSFEAIYLREFNSDKDKLIEFIKSSFEKLKSENNQIDDDLSQLQVSSMRTTWDNDYDEVWDEL